MQSRKEEGEEVKVCGAFAVYGPAENRRRRMRENESDGADGEEVEAEMSQEKKIFHPVAMCHSSYINKVPLYRAGWKHAVLWQGSVNMTPEEVTGPDHRNVPSCLGPALVVERSSTFNSFNRKR